MTQIKESVFLLEDDATTRKNIENKIQSGAKFELVGSASTLLEARKQLLTLQPDVLLVDLQLPDGDGTELIAEYTARYPSRPILVISVFGDETSVVRAISAVRVCLLRNGRIIRPAG